MDNIIYAINQTELRKNGVRLGRLALIGELAVVVGIVAAPLVLYAIAHPAEPELGFPAFFMQLLMTGPSALANLYGVVQGVALFATLDRTRQLGRALSSDNPLARETVHNLKWLGYSMALLAITMCIGVDVVPTSTGFKQEPVVRFSPLYFGAMALIGLSIARRVIGEAIALRAEAQEFI